MRTRQTVSRPPLPNQVARRTALLSAIILVAAALAGCATTGQSAATSCPAPTGSSASAVHVTTTSTAVPHVAFPTPLKPTQTEIHDVTQGHGKIVPTASFLKLKLSAYNGTSGKAIIEPIGYSSDHPALYIQPTSHELTAGLQQGLTCVRVGETRVIAIPAADMYGAKGNTAMGLRTGDAAVFVATVEGAYPSRAAGKELVPSNAFPTVTRAPNGQPGIAALHVANPKHARHELTIRGTGTTVQRDDHVLAQYTMFDGSLGTVISSTWGSGGLQSIPVSASVGLQSALAGQRVGSQVIVILPHSEGAPFASSLSDGAALVMVIDILGVEH